MSETLFTGTPAVTDASDGTPGITTATTLQFSAVGRITAIRFYATATVSGTYIARLYEVTADDAGGGAGTQLATVTLSAPPAPGWNTVALPSPVVVATNKLYRPSIFSGDGRYVATPGMLTGADLTSGHITAWRNGADPIGLGSIRNGTFAINAVPTYPASGGGAAYFVDVVYIEGVGVTVNSRIVPSATGVGAIVNPGVAGTPAVEAVVLVDGSGNVIKAADNGDGTATLASTVSVAVEPAASTVPVNFSTSAAISATAKDYRGFALRETSGTAGAVVRVFDHASAASGTVLDEIALAPGESAREFYGDGGMKTSNGIYAQLVSGAVAGSIRTAV